MDEREYTQFLKDKGMKHGDKVSFRVENQSCYYGPLNGTLDLETASYPFMRCDHNGSKVHVTVGRGYDAYIGTIEKRIDRPWWDRGQYEKPE